MKKISVRIILAVFLIIALFSPQFVLAQSPPKEEKFEAVVTAVKEERQIEINGKKQLYQKLELKATSGRQKDKNIIVENGSIPLVKVQKYKTGDKLIITLSKTADGKDIYYITDYIRRDSLYWIFAIFIGLAVFIGRKRGILSLVGMVISFFIIFTFVLPQISAGNDPIIIAIIASFFIIPLTFYLSHGLNIKTTAAVIGTLIALVITGILANVFVDSVRLTGFASEEAGFLEMMKQGVFDMKALLLAGIIIGVLGILDDITISQAAIVYQLKQTSPKLSIDALYSRAMDIGKDHIASMVNTLVLVYTGAAMPLLLLFINNPIAFFTFYSLMELIRFRKITTLPYWFYIKALLVILGAASAYVTLLSGELIEEMFEEGFGSLVEVHSFLAKITT